MPREMKPGERSVHLIGGSHGGETFVTSQPVIRLPCMENVDFPPPIGPADTITDAKFEVYRVERVRFESGHEHNYGILEPMRLVDAMNVMWNGYQDSLGR